MSKTFFTDGEALVLASLQGLTAISPELILNKHTKSIINAHHDASRNVTLIAGGGAGHEPAHAAFVGRGLLSAAVSGNIFASPSVKQIVDTIHAVGGSAGTIIIVKNYTGDIFHFHLAAEKARARWGMKVEVLVVGDDVAVGRRQSGKVGRRGLAGTVLVHKILGALSAQGKSLDEILAIGRQVVDGLATCGASQGHVHIPGTAFHEEHVQLELGMGIHNEPGFRVLDPRPKFDDLLDQMLDMLLKKDDDDRAFVDFDGVNPVLLVNNLGGTSQLEMGAIVHHTVTSLKKRGVTPSRVLAGTFMTSLDASGFSITLLKARPDIISALDLPTSALGWPQGSSNFEAYQGEQVVGSPRSDAVEPPMMSEAGPRVNNKKFITAVTRACWSLIAAEPSITHYDRIVGDGDCGTTLSRGANAVLASLSHHSSGEVDVSIGAAVMQIASALEDSMDGTSGAIYELFFTALAAAFQSLPQEEATVKTWGDAAGIALQKLCAMTAARVGDRTLMDALVPFVEALARGDIKAAVDAAIIGRDSTIGMTASLGRAVYVASDNWGKVPDPGAEGVVALLKGLTGQTSN